MYLFSCMSLLCILLLCVFYSLVILTVLYHCEWQGVVKLGLCAVLSLFGTVYEQWLALFSAKRLQSRVIVGEDSELLSGLPDEWLLKPVGFIVIESAGAKVFNIRKKILTRATHSKAV